MPPGEPRRPRTTRGGLQDAGSGIHTRARKFRPRESGRRPRRLRPSAARGRDHASGERLRPARMAARHRRHAGAERAVARVAQTGAWPRMIHALPGMGADHRMYPEPWETLPGFKAHDWVMSPEITSVRQLAEVMIEACAIADGDVLVGSSLGGIVAGEM